MTRRSGQVRKEGEPRLEPGLSVAPINSVLKYEASFFVAGPSRTTRTAEPELVAAIICIEPSSAAGKT